MPPQFFSGLTDVQWDRVRLAAFGDHPAPDAGRQTIDGLLFRLRAWCPWSVLPSDFPDGNELKAQAAFWSADGTWARALQALPEPPTKAPVSQQPTGLRKRLANAVRRIPGGQAALAPARKMIRFAQDLRSRSTPLALLPTVFQEAQSFLHAGEFSTAIDRYTHVLSLVPVHVQARLNRGLAQHRLGHHVAARDDLLVTLSLPGLSLDDRTQANLLLSEVYLWLGDLDRAVGHAFLARLLRRYGPDAPWDQDELAEEADEFELLAEAHSEVSEYAINFASNFAAAAELSQRRSEIHHKYERWLATVPAQTLYLSGDWVRNIGHIALLDYWAKIRALGWLTRLRIVVHAPTDKTANRAYLNLFKPFMKIVVDPAPGGATRHLATTFGPHVACVLHLPGHADRYFFEGMGVIQEEWERQGREPLLSLSDDDLAAGREAIRAMGVPEGGWFVALHVRSPGFHKEQHSPYQAHRNADICTYLPAIREVVRRGGWVVRIGDASMPPLPPTPGAVDYATSSHKSDRMDVFLTAACRFFIGVASGMAQLPVTFGVPAVFTNWMSNALPVNSRRDLFIPKRVWSDHLGRVLTFEEWLAPSHRPHYIAATEMYRVGLREVDNTPEELSEAVVEMMDQLDGQVANDPADTRRAEAFNTLARRQGQVGFARMSRAFLRRHEQLLEQSP